MISRAESTKKYIFLILQNCSDWKELQEVSGPTFCWKCGELGNQTRLLWAFSNIVMETSKKKNCTALLGKLFYCLTVLMMKMFFFSPVQTSLVSSYPCCLSCYCWAPLWKAWLCLLDHLPLRFWKVSVRCPSMPSLLWSEQAQLTKNRSYLQHGATRLY